MTDIWDDPELASAMAGGAFMKWENVGDSVVGTFLSIDAKGGEDFKGNVCPLATVERDDGEIVKLTLSQWKLKNALWDARPRPGDRVAIVFTGEEPPTTKGHSPTKLFEVEVKRSEVVAAEKPSSLL